MLNRRRLGAVIFALLGPVTASAQSPGRPFDELSQILKPGDRLVVVNSTTRGDTKGRLVDLSPASLVLLLEGTPDARQTFTDSNITQIRRADPLLNGALMGLQVGLGVGLADVALVFLRSEGPIFTRCGGDSRSQFLACSLTMTAAMAGAGAAIGALIDESIEETVYRSPRVPRVTLSPALAGDRVGVLLSVAF